MTGRTWGQVYWTIAAAAGVRRRGSLWLAGLLSLAPGWTAASEPLTIESAVVTLVDRVEIPARTSGLLAQVYVKEGGRVQRGAAIALVDPALAGLARDAAQLEVENAEHLAANALAVEAARTEAQIAVAELERAQSAADKFANSVSASELDELRLRKVRTELAVQQAIFDQETARRTVAAKQQQLRIAEGEWQRHVAVTPLDGAVAELYKRQGEWVEAGEAIARIVRTDVMHVEGFLAAVDATADLVGARVQCTVQVARDRQATVDGVVTLVGAEVHPVNLKVRVVVEIDNRQQQLRPGLSATITVLP